MAISAAEAKKLNDAYAASLIVGMEAIIDGKIRDVAKRGITIVTIDFCDVDLIYREKVYEEIQKTFSRLGFKINREQKKNEKESLPDIDNVILSW